MNSAGDVHVFSYGDGGTTLQHWLTDGGLIALEEVPETLSMLAVDDEDALLGFDPSSGTLYRLAGDGGLEVFMNDAGARSLIAVRGQIITSGQYVLHRTLTGLSSVSLNWDAGIDDGGIGLDERFVLADKRSIYALYRRCPAPFTSCLPDEELTFVRVWDSATGAVRIDQLLLGPGAKSKVHTAALLARSETVALFAEEQTADGGKRAFVQVVTQGQSGLECPLPQAPDDVRSALFSNQHLFFLESRGDGGSFLHSYSARGVPLSISDWPTANGVNGQQRAVP